jgi:hypothetical protein
MIGPSENLYASTGIFNDQRGSCAPMLEWFMCAGKCVVLPQDLVGDRWLASAWRRKDWKCSMYSSAFAAAVINFTRFLAPARLGRIYLAQLEGTAVHQSEEELSGRRHGHCTGHTRAWLGVCTFSG